MQQTGTGSSEQVTLLVKLLLILLRKQKVHVGDEQMSCVCPMAEWAAIVLIVITAAATVSAAVCGTLREICSLSQGDHGEPSSLPAPQVWRVDDTKGSANVNEWNGQTESGMSRRMNEGCFK